MDQERSSLGMTNKGHMAQQLQMPLVTVVVMILHDNWRHKGDKETSAVSCKKYIYILNKQHKEAWNDNLEFTQNKFK